MKTKLEGLGKLWSAQLGDAEVLFIAQQTVDGLYQVWELNRFLEGDEPDYTARKDRQIKRYMENVIKELGG